MAIMEKQGNFEIQLVEAETKTPFKEHTKDGTTYVEVEPGAEFFMKVRKLGVSNVGKVACTFAIDGQKLDYHVSYVGCDVDTEASYQGIWSRKNGESVTTALRFSPLQKARLGGSTSSKRKSSLSPLFMGKVEMKILELVFDGYSSEQEKDFVCSFTPAAVDEESIKAMGTKAKKAVQSETGSTCIREGLDSDNSGSPVYRFGRCLETITLNYCSAAGLMVVGVLEKPRNPYDYYQLVRPSPTTDNTPMPKPTKIRKTIIMMGRTEVTEWDLFDLTADDDDDDDETCGATTSDATLASPLARANPLAATVTPNSTQEEAN